MRNRLKKILNYMDDMLILAGIGCIARAGFLLGDVYGFAAAGIGLIGYGIVIAKGGAGEC